MNKPNKRIQLANNFSLEMDNFFKLNVKYEGWEAWPVLEYFHSRNIARFRYILAQYELYDIAKIYALSYLELRLRIQVHLTKEQRLKMFQLLKSKEIREFVKSEKETDFF